MRKIGLLVVVFGLLFITSNNALACSCLIEKDLRKAIVAEFNNASIVFTGKKIAAEYIPAIKKDAQGKEIEVETLVYRFLVDKLWKGKSKGEVILYTDVYRQGDVTTITSCDFNFKTGEKYLIYATPDQEGKLQRNVCGRTNLITKAEMDIKEIQKLRDKMKH